MIRISFKKFSLLLLMNFLIFSMSSCKPYDWQHDNCNWICEKSYIELYGKNYEYNDKGQTNVLVQGKMIVSEIEYFFVIAGSNDHKESFFYEAYKDNLHEYQLLLHSNVEYKDEKLYFTVVEDGGFDLVGKTLVFSKISCF